MLKGLKANTTDLTATTEVALIDSEHTELLIFPETIHVNMEAIKTRARLLTPILYPTAAYERSSEANLSPVSNAGSSSSKKSSKPSFS